MAVLRNIFNIIFALIVASCLLLANASPVPTEFEEASAESSNREGRFYGGLAGANANAFASSGATGLGYPGFGVGSANAIASASAGSTGFGYPYGK